MVWKKKKSILFIIRTRLNPEPNKNNKNIVPCNDNNTLFVLLICFVWPYFSISCHLKFSKYVLVIATTIITPYILFSTYCVLIRKARPAGMATNS